MTLLVFFFYLLEVSFGVTEGKGWNEWDIKHDLTYESQDFIVPGKDIDLTWGQIHARHYVITL